MVMTLARKGAGNDENRHICISYSFVMNSLQSKAIPEVIKVSRSTNDTGVALRPGGPALLSLA